MLFFGFDKVLKKDQSLKFFILHLIIPEPLIFKSEQHFWKLHFLSKCKYLHKYMYTLWILYIGVYCEYVILRSYLATNPHIDHSDLYRYWTKSRNFTVQFYYSRGGGGLCNMHTSFFILKTGEKSALNRCK